jgi:hypothetical protein
VSHDFSSEVELAGVLAALDVDVTAAKQDINGLADAIQEAVRSEFHGADAVEFGLNQMRTLMAQCALEVALPLFL